MTHTDGSYTARQRYPRVKRLLDVLGSVLLLVVLAPLLLVLIGISLITQGRPVFFVQERPGLHGVPFRLIKFRTMRTTTVRDVAAVASDAERLTRWGSFLRVTSLDELPELINILRGDMSFVGPRPLLMEYLPLYSAEQARRHEVRPGLTGLAQVEGRNALDWPARFRFDVAYVDALSLRTDCAILARTVGVVCSRKDVSAAGAVTVEPFRGER